MKIKEIKKLRREIPPLDIECGNCFECCCSPIAMNFSELVEIRKKFGDHARHPNNSLCPWYDTVEQKCAVYDERSLICRMFGQEKGRLTCSHNPSAAKFEDMEFSPTIIGGKYFADLGIPKIMIDHFDKNIFKIRGMGKFKIFK